MTTEHIVSDTEACPCEPEVLVVPPRVLDFTEAGDTELDTNEAEAFDDLEESAELLRNLVISGGNPYILIVVTAEGAQVTFQGLPPETVAPGLIELGTALQAGPPAEEVA